MKLSIIALRAETRLQCEETMEFNIDLVGSGGDILPCNVCTIYVCYMHSLHFSMSVGKTNFSNVGVIILDVQKNP